MPIRKHGKGYEVRVQHGGVRTSKTLPSRRDAQELETRIRQGITDSAVGRVPRYSLEEAVERWLTGEASVLKSIDDLKDKVRSIFPLIQGKSLAQVVEVAELVKTAGLQSGAKPATINRKLAILRRVANLAYRQWDWLDKPLGMKVRLLAGERPRETFLTPAQVRRLAGEATPAVRDAILLAAMTGLRRGELLRLKPEDRKGGYLTVVAGKSGRPRVIPLPPEAVKIPLPLTVDKHSLRKGYDEARRRTGIKAQYRDLRHTYASWLVQGGASMTAVRDLLGHSSLAVTSRYAHLATKHLREAVDKLPTIGMGRKKKAA